MTDLVDTRASPSGKLLIPIVLHFGGDVPDAGLDAEEVASVADGLSKAIQFLAKRADDGQRDFVLHLTEIRPGSAIFTFLLEAAGAFQSVLPVLTASPFSIKQIGEVVSEVMKLLEFLKGKPPQHTVNMQGEAQVSVTNSNGAKVQVTQHVYKIAGDVYFTEQMSRTVRPLRKVGRTLALRQEGHVLHTTSSDRYPALTAQPLESDSPIISNIIEATLKVRQPHLESEDAWRFSWGRNAITATLADQDFMNKVTAGQEEFRAGDVLRVKLRIEEQQKGRNVTKKHFIDEVIRRERAS